MKSEVLRDVTAGLFKSAADHTATLVPYVITKSVLAQLQGKQAAFAATVRGTNALIG